MQCSAPAAFGGTASGRRPAIFSSPKRSTARGYGLAGISVPGPAYAMHGVGPVGAVHAPVPFNGWGPGWSKGGPSFGAPQDQFNQWSSGGSGVPATQPRGVNVQGVIDSITGVAEKLLPLVFGPKTPPGQPDYSSNGTGLQTQAQPAGGIPNWVWYGGAALAAVVVVAAVARSR